MLSLVVVFVVCRSSGEAASNTIQARRRRAAAAAHADEGTHTHHLSARRLKAVLISFSSSVACGAEGGERERVVGRGEMGDRAPPPAKQRAQAQQRSPAERRVPHNNYLDLEDLKRLLARDLHGWGARLGAFNPRARARALSLQACLGQTRPLPVARRCEKTSRPVRRPEV